jgi:hypothetical protein
MLVFGLVFLVAGLAFKLGAVPFHMWVPDVYDGSPTAVTLLLGGAPKLAPSPSASACWWKACCRWHRLAADAAGAGRAVAGHR